MAMNNFKVDLKYSLEARDLEGLDQFYHKVFPNLERIELVEDKERQLRGIDKILHFKNGKQISIDEKKRRTTYPDILLEEYSNWENRKVGWLGKEKYTDYIIYIKTQSMEIYFLPFLLLQMVWIKNYKAWLGKYGRIFSDNKYYRTSNIPVPTEILLETLKNEMVLI